MIRPASRFLVPAFISAMTVLTITAQEEGTAAGISHTPRDFDRLHPDISFVGNSIASVDTAGRVVRYNSSLFLPSDDAGIAFYLSPDTISYVQSATKHLFKFSNDSLSYLGFENRASTFSIDAPIDLFDLNLPDGAATCSEWRGRLTLYGNDYLKCAKGFSRTAVSGGWTLIDDNDSICNASHVVWDMEMEYFDSGSIDVSLPDSLNSPLVSDLDLPVAQMAVERILQNREMWFSPDARYPVLQRSRVFRLRDDGDGDCDTIPVSFLAMHYPQDFQTDDTGEEPPRFRPSDKGACNSLFSGSQKDGSGAISIMAENPAGSDHLDVTLICSDSDRDVALTLYTDSGIRLSDTVTVRAGVLPRTYTLPLPRETTGVVILHIESGPENFSRKIIL